MKRWQAGALSLALLLVPLVAGCGAPPETATPPGGGSSGPAQAGRPVAGAALGSEEAAGPFRVTLTTEPAEPKVGTATLKAAVTREGKPVKDATVRVSLSMPTMSMGGPEVTLEPAGSGYQGTADLSMGGDFEAKVTVTAGGDTGTTTYHFVAMQ